MVDKVRVGYLIPTAAQEHLRSLAERDHRSLSGEVAWLIEQEWRRHALALGLRHAQRVERARAKAHERGGAGGTL